ncbi:UNVERIFIED_CONTAM: hypothetical protein Sangu_2620600 [Sesamum angustifolium]|uniref:N-acetyl-D-glucosamine kinase n=1 Tax=Sesamum angustifolium TaxID=2727405 RepID=A0AAW2J705_9LAMI
MKRYRNGEIWDFEHDVNMVAAAHCNGGKNDSKFLNYGVNGRKVILGIDGGTTSTVCICIPLIPFTQPLPDPLPVLARSVAGCSNHNSVGVAWTGSEPHWDDHVCIISGDNMPCNEAICWISDLLHKLPRSMPSFVAATIARETLEQVMADALARSASTRSAVEAVCLSVSGVNHPTDQHRIINWLREIFPSHVRLFVQNDAVAALASGTMGKLHGCVLIAGTVAFKYMVNLVKALFHMKEGPVFIGYGIAAQALTAVIRAHDGRGPETTLTHSILDALNLSSPDELIGWTYSDPSWARIAALVPVVVSCADAGDPVANNILHDTVHELASSVRAVVERLELCGEDGKDPFPLVMVGGVLEANRRWDIGNEVISCISGDFPGVLPIRPKVEPAVGAALLAWNFLMRQRHQEALEDNHHLYSNKRHYTKRSVQTSVPHLVLTYVV